LLFFLFPIFRIDTRFNRLKKQLSEKSDFNNTFTQEPTNKKTVRHLKITELAIVIFMTVFIIFNYTLGCIAYDNSNHPKLIFHMAVIITTSFAFTTFMLISKVNECFTELEEIISEWSKEPTSK